MKNGKQRLMWMLILVLSIGMSSSIWADVTKPAVFRDDMSITLNGTVYDAKMVMIEGESYVPIHILGFVVNAITDFDEVNRIVRVNKQLEPVEVKKISQTLDGTYGNKIAYFSDKIKLVVDGKQLKDQVIIVEGRSYLPLKAIAEQLGVRVNVDEANKTIKVNNPQLTEVEKDFEDFYIKELPVVEKEADYLVGNWAGELKSPWSRGERTSKLKAFISQNENGTYKVVLDWTDIFYSADQRLVTQYTRGVDKSKFNFVYDKANKVFSMNHYGVMEYTATFDAQTGLLTCVPTKLIKSFDKKDKVEGKANFTFKLEEEILHFYSSSGKNGTDGKTTGQLERF